jgi:hypothetical protein
MTNKQYASIKTSDATQPDRLYYLDWLRVLAILKNHGRCSSFSYQYRQRQPHRRYLVLDLSGMPADGIQSLFYSFMCSDISFSPMPKSGKTSENIIQISLRRRRFLRFSTCSRTLALFLQSPA